MLLRRLRGLSAAASVGLWRALSTASSHPPWAMIHYTKVRTSSAQRAWAELAKAPAVSHLVVPDHIVGLGPRPQVDPDSDVLSTLVGRAAAHSGDGLLFLDFQNHRVTAPVVATHAAGATQHRKLTGARINLYSASGQVQERKVTGINMNPDMVRFVCNPISGELFRLPDIDGTKKTAPLYRFGLLAQSPQGHGPPDRFAVAELSEGLHGEKGTFIMRRFLSQTGEWEKLAPFPSPLPLPCLMDIHNYHEVLAFAGRLWWVDLSWGAISADPFSNRPELRFVELPRGSVLPVQTWAEEFAKSAIVQGKKERR
ncbi:hypothetical protein QOZ80_5BG0417620 [Eleusine coracana subsp. coracana]|nr:hypothetical protein QOZ80_5BG0417620 [Eleusine coracana subsp. coracana]